MARESYLTGGTGNEIHVRPTGSSTTRSQGVVLAMESTDTLIPASTRGLRIDDAATAIVDGRLTVPTPGTPVQISGATTAKAVALFALPANTKRCMVGASTVKASDSLFQGIPIEPGSGIILSVTNANLLFIDAVVANEGVTWTVLS